MNALTARGSRPTSTLLLATLLLATTTGCSSLNKLVVNKFADALGGFGAVLASDEDPELIRDALPFALKLMETLLEQTPEKTSLLLSACQGFTLYGAGFVDLAADRLELTSYREAERQRQRALKLYLRARGYCFRALDLKYPGTSVALVRDPGNALAGILAEDVQLLYWTAGSWGFAIAGGLDRPELLADLPAIRALLEEAMELDEGWDRGSLHGAMMLLQLAERSSGAGTVERARAYYDRALELSGGSRAGTYVSWANLVARQDQDREEFERQLELALAVDVECDPTGRPSTEVEDCLGSRLTNVIQQDRARFLLSQADDLFF